MSKHTYFTGQPILSQLIKLIPRELVERLAVEYQADRYCKRFFTWDHLVSMLFAGFCDCQSLREVTTGMLAAEQKLRHLGLRHTPRRSTLSDANNRREEALFGALFHRLSRQLLPDSRGPGRRLHVIDSTTVSLFSDVLANAGRPGADGRRKGGVKVHTMMSYAHRLPEFIVLTPASRHDTPFLRQLEVPKGSILCFDKGYWDYRLFTRWSQPDRQIGFVTRLKAGSVVQHLADRRVDAHQRRAGVLSDGVVRLGHTHQANHPRPVVRLVRYRDPAKARIFTFVSNCMDLPAEQIAALYRKRWAIELLFKRIKSAYPLKYFLGESVNAIKIQLWCILICDLLISQLLRRHKRRWSYRNLRSMIRLHYLSYVDLQAFLADPLRALLQYACPPDLQADLFRGGLGNWNSS